jgi:hypothetical protein
MPVSLVGCDKRAKRQQWCAGVEIWEPRFTGTDTTGRPRRHTISRIRSACHTLPMPATRIRSTCSVDTGKSSQTWV